MAEFDTGEFSVVQFFPDDSYEYVRRNVSVEEAMKTAHHYCTCVGARIGTTVKVLITDGEDLTCFHWEYRKGVLFPPPPEQHES